MLYDNVPLNYEVHSDSGAIAYTYQLNDEKVPLHGGCELRIGLRRQPVADRPSIMWHVSLPKEVCTVPEVLTRMDL